METKLDVYARLHEMKEQEPFKAFDVTTMDGSVLPVSGRYLFAFNSFYAVFADVEGRPVRVRLEKISQIDQKH